jgi:hypothetical protein
MFESEACDHLRVVDPPFVDSQALIELKAVFESINPCRSEPTAVRVADAPDRRCGA